MKRMITDAQDLEHLVIKLYETETLNDDEYNFEGAPEVVKLANGIKYCYDHNMPLIIVDFGNDLVYFSNSIEAGDTDGSIYNAYFITYGQNVNNFIQWFVHVDFGATMITMNSTNEEMATTDNIKTLFGNKSIIGQGNIDLYNHFLTITLTNDTKLYTNFYSSNGLLVDSIQDLTTITKATSGYKMAVGNTYITYNGSIWQTANSVAVKSITDSLKTI